jgi:PAS domain S-box-containing protein
LVAILLLLPRRIWPILIPAGLAGFVLYDLQVGVSVRSIAWLILADIFEILVAAWGVSYSLDGLPRLNSLKALAKYSFFTVILASLIVSSIGIYGLNGDRWFSWRISLLSEGLAFLTVTPAILGWVGQARTWLRASPAYYLEATVLIAALVSLSYFMFVARGRSAPPALLYSLVPFLLWSALRFGSTGAATSATVVALLSIWGAVHGRGPFTETDPIHRVFLLQLFLLFTVVPFMVLAALVEERKQAMELRHRLAAIVESSDDAIIGKNIDGIITAWNKGAEQLYGYRAGEVIGKSISLLMPSGYSGDFSIIMAKLRRGETVKNYDTLRQRKDGTCIQVSLTVSPISNFEGRIVGASAIARDISERKRQEAVLRESEERFRLMADTAPTLIWMSGTDKLCTFFNQGWLNFTGRSMAQELGEGWASGVHPDDLERCLGIYSTAFDSRVDFEMEYRLRRSDGAYRWIVDYGVPRFGSNGAFCGYIGSCIDITDRKVSEMSLRELSGRLIHAQEEERARIARELHDDLSQRMALLEIGLEQFEQNMPGLTSNDRGQLHNIAQIASEVSSDLHDLSRQLHPAKLDLQGLVAAMGSLCRELSKQHDLQIKFVHHDVPSQIRRDVALCLFRIAQEALRNVVKHSGTVEAKVELHGHDDRIDLGISDSGAGFSPESAQARAGLGLLSMRERLRLIGGQLAVESRPSHGTRICARVPLSDGTGQV